MFQEVDDDGDGGYPDWTLTLHSLFDDDEHHVVELDVDEPSMIDVIRSRQEGDGREFRMEDEIDQATDMFITRVCRRISAQPELLASGGLH